MCFNLAACFGLSQVRNFWPLYVFTFSLFFITWVYMCKSFALHTDVLGPDAPCPVIWGFRRRLFKTSGWPWADIFKPVGLLPLWHIHYIYSRNIKRSQKSVYGMPKFAEHVFIGFLFRYFMYILDTYLLRFHCIENKYCIGCIIMNNGTKTCTL